MVDGHKRSMGSINLTSAPALLSKQSCFSLIVEPTQDRARILALGLEIKENFSPLEAKLAWKLSTLCICMCGKFVFWMFNIDFHFFVSDRRVDEVVEIEAPNRNAKAKRYTVKSRYVFFIVYLQFVRFRKNILWMKICFKGNLWWRS